MVSRLEELRAELKAQSEDCRLKLEALDHGLHMLDRRVAAVEASRVFRIFRWVGNWLTDRKGKVGQLLLHSPLHPVYLKFFGRRAKYQYEAWVALERARRPSPEWYGKTARSFARRPLFSILLPVHQPRPEWLAKAVESVQAQSYPHWELCACDDASGEAWVGQYFAEKTKVEPRVRFVASTEHLGISGALNRAGELARGDYIVLLDQDDVFAPHLLYHLVERLQGGDADLLYTDEDRLDENGHRVDPIFKPDWSPELLAGCMYMGHCLAVSVKAIARVGWFRSEFDGSQDYDLVLRLTDARGVVLHIPHVLYHWRKHAGSTSARASSKPYAQQAARRALQEALRRRGWRAVVEETVAPHRFRLRWNIDGEPRASLIICSRTASLLKSCLRAIERNTTYRNREIIVVQHMVDELESMERLLATVPCQRVRYAGPFNFSKMSNLGASVAGGDVLVFLNDDVKPLIPDWLTNLVAQAQRPDVGVVGAKLLYPSGSIQHVGMAIGIMDGCGHPLRRTYGSRFWHWHEFTRDVSAVTGACLAIRRSVFEQLGGWDERFPMNYGDADLCLRARRAGYKVLCEPAAVLCHYECKSRSPGTLHGERALWHSRWGALLTQGDPFYNPNLTTTREDASLRFDP